jgi:hypothetical protein
VKWRASRALMQFQAPQLSPTFIRVASQSKAHLKQTENQSLQKLKETRLDLKPSACTSTSSAFRRSLISTPATLLKSYRSEGSTNEHSEKMLAKLTGQASSATNWSMLRGGFTKSDVRLTKHQRARRIVNVNRPDFLPNAQILVFSTLINN